MQNTKIYDHMIYLGRNCEFPNRFIERYEGIEATTLLWTKVRDRFKCIEAIRNYHLIFSEGYDYVPEDNMFSCAKFNILYHGKHTPDEIKKPDGTLDEGKKALDFMDLRMRINYLGSKTLKICASNELKLFVTAFKPENIEEDIAYIKYLQFNLNMLNPNFDLLVIVEENENVKELELFCSQFKNIIFRIIKEFAPDDRTDINLDPHGWDNVFEFFAAVNIKKRTELLKFERMQK